MERYICIHGHFYQPPRENPWLEAIELQDSAYPYHDWNERIAAECYARNGISRILDPDGRIEQLVNNYSNMSFNFGPTLLAWLEEKAPETYRSIIDADADSRERFSGHGSALAQPYNHMILPLADARDRRTQILWGIADFEHRFGRRPEGLWLPETAVDLESLDIAAEYGVRFVILAQRQAHKVRRIGEREWHDVSESRIDPKMPYRQLLPSGRSISLFFYDEAISRAVAFEGLLSNGEAFAERLMGAFSSDQRRPELVHIATDGESYGHHHHGGEMALAYALRHIEASQEARLTNYGEFLEMHPPTHDVKIFENSSWSCVHGIERWREDCGCNSGGYPQWNQGWRKPLRDALDWLRDQCRPLFERNARRLLNEPWDARDAYISVVLDRSPGNVHRFLKHYAARPLDEAERVTVLKLMELQRHAMLMYTSCGWFFDELSGIETVQVIQYAARVVQIAGHLGAADLEAAFLNRLEAAKSNISEHRDGRAIYEKFVLPAAVDLQRVAVHYAISSVFEDYEDRSTIFAYSAVRETLESFRVGNAKLLVGRVELSSTITLLSDRFFFGVLHLGDHNISCGIGQDAGEARYRGLLEEASEAFAAADFPQIIVLLAQYFGTSTYSLTSLFRDEQRKVLDLIMEPSLKDAQNAYALLYEHHAPLIRFVRSSGIPLHKSLATAAEVVLNARIKDALGETSPDAAVLQSLMEEARLAGVVLEAPSLELAFRRSVEVMADSFSEDPYNASLLDNLNTAANLVRTLPFEVNLWYAQNIAYKVVQSMYSDLRNAAKSGDQEACRQVERLGALADNLRLKLPEDEEVSGTQSAVNVAKTEARSMKR